MAGRLGGWLPPLSTLVRSDRVVEVWRKSGASRPDFLLLLRFLRNSAVMPKASRILATMITIGTVESVVQSAVTVSFESTRILAVKLLVSTAPTHP